MCGKSALIDVVAEMTRTDDRPTTIIRINPSLVDSKSLYGYFDADMLEWVPGIFSHILGTLASMNVNLYFIGYKLRSVITGVNRSIVTNICVHVDAPQFFFLRTGIAEILSLKVLPP